MAARNDITGVEIKSGILSSEGRDNWDKAFGKKSIAEWLRIAENSTVIIADDNPVSYKEFCERVALINKNTI